MKLKCALVIDFECRLLQERNMCQSDKRSIWFQEIADIYEKEEDMEKAMLYYDKAADLYSGEGVESTGNQCKLKVAQYAASLEQ